LSTTFAPPTLKSISEALGNEHNPNPIISTEEGTIELCRGKYTRDDDLGNKMVVMDGGYTAHISGPGGSVKISGYQIVFVPGSTMDQSLIVPGEEVAFAPAKFGSSELWIRADTYDVLECELVQMVEAE
jgi:hypothetical protein